MRNSCSCNKSLCFTEMKTNRFAMFTFRISRKFSVPLTKRLFWVKTSAVKTAKISIWCRKFCLPKIMSPEFLSDKAIGGFTSSQRTIGVLLINCSLSGMFYCVLWYVSLFVVVCGMSSEKPYLSDAVKSTLRLRGGKYLLRLAMLLTWWENQRKTWLCVMACGHIWTMWGICVCVNTCTHDVLMLNKRSWNVELFYRR